MLTYIHIVIYNTSITLVTYFTSSKKFIHASVYVCDTARPYVAWRGRPLLTFQNYLSITEIRLLLQSSNTFSQAFSQVVINLIFNHNHSPLLDIYNTDILMRKFDLWSCFTHVKRVKKILQMNISRKNFSVLTKM